jgi:hypothetical protein
MGIFNALAKPAELYLPTLKLWRIPLSHSSPSFWPGHSAKAGKFNQSIYGGHPSKK